MSAQRKNWLLVVWLFAWGIGLTTFVRPSPAQAEWRGGTNCQYLSNTRPTALPSVSNSANWGFVSDSSWDTIFCYINWGSVTTIAQAHFTVPGDAKSLRLYGAAPLGLPIPYNINLGIVGQAYEYLAQGVNISTYLPYEVFPQPAILNRILSSGDPRILSTDWVHEIRIGGNYNDSVVFTIEKQAAVPLPGDFTLTGTSLCEGTSPRNTLSWSASSNAATYTIQRGSTVLKTQSASEPRTFTDSSGLQDGQAYQYKVTAYNATGGTVRTVTIQTANCAPTPIPTPTSPTPTPTATPTPTPTPTPTTTTPTPTPTPSTAPFVSTEPATIITTTTATLNGRGDPRGSAAIGWFRYATTNPGTCNDTFGTRAPATGGTSLGSTLGTYVPFSHSFTNLLPDTTYYYCAIGENAIAKGYGEIRSFTTVTALPQLPSLMNILRGSFAARDIRFAPIDLLIEYDPRIVFSPPPGFYGLHPIRLQEAY